MRAAVIHAEWQPRPGYQVGPREHERREARVGSQVWQHPTLHIEEMRIPHPGPDEVIVRTQVCGVCGSDRRMAQSDADGYMRYPGYTRLPVVPGHEFAGDVVEVGADVASMHVGDAVACDNMVWCGRCAACRAGAFNQCEALEEIGFTVAGGLAQFVRVPARCCWPIAPLVERWGGAEGFEAGALVEPAAVAYQGIFVEAGGVREDAAVVVYGAGPIGLAAIALAHAAGARPVIAFQRPGIRSELARRLGADVFDPDDRSAVGRRPRDVVMELTRGAGATLQIEAAGAPADTVPEMLASLAPRGTILLLGRSPETATIFLDRLVVAAARIVGSTGHAGPHAFPGVIEMMARGTLDLRPMVTDRLPLERAATELVRAGALGEGKVLVVLDRREDAA